MAATMKAFGVIERGPVDNLKELELPIAELGPHDILVKMAGTGMNPVDYKKRSAAFGEATTEAMVFGYDGSGSVEKLGSEAKLFKEGDKVYFAGDITRRGTNSEYCVVDERIVGHAPTTISMAQAASVPLTMLTAWEGVFEHLHLKAFDPANSGKTLLILPGAGGVGSFVIQLAKKLCGLTVIATASRPESAAAAKALGACHTVNHREPLKPQLEALGISSVNYIYNAYQTDVYFDQYCDIIAPLGHIVTIVETDVPLPMTKLMGKRAFFSWELMFTRSLFGVDPIQQHHILNNAARLIDTGLLTLPAVTVRPYTLENLKKMHEEQATGKMIGKNVLEM